MKPDLANQIESLTKRLLQHYQLAQSLIERIEQLETYESKVELFAKLKIALNDAKLIESELSPLRQAVESHGISVSSATKECMEKTTSIVLSLIPRLGELEKMAQSERSRLAPQIHEGVRAMKMQSAYSQH